MRQFLNATKPLRKGLMGVSLLTLCLSGPVLAQTAQDSVYIDISDPSITIDLSVLEDSGRGPAQGIMPNLTAKASKPGTFAKPKNPLQTFGTSGVPVSTLYIQPSKVLSLPPQTKPLLKLRASTLKVAEKTVTSPAPRKKIITAKTTSPLPSTPSAPGLKTPVAQTKMVEPVVKAAVAPTPVVKTPKAVAKASPPATTPAPVAKAPVAKAPVAKVPVVRTPVVVKVEKAPPAAPAMRPTTPPAAPMALSTPKPVAKAPVVGMPAPPPPQAVAKAPKTMSPPTSPPASPPVVSKNETIVDLPAKATQPGVASLPSPTQTLSDGDNMRIVFAQDSSKLPQDARDALKALSDKMKSQDSLRLQLLAYAGTADMSASAARRLSLSRALAVRSHLIESGVRSTRIDVRALGNKSSDEVTERVDITVVER